MHVNTSSVSANLHLPYILQVESDWQLEVQLDGGTLVITPDGIFNLNVNL